MAELLQLRRATAAQWTSFNTVLADGEPAVEVDSGLVKIGDGATAWTSLPYLTERYNRGPKITGTSAFTAGTNITLDSSSYVQKLGGGWAMCFCLGTWTGATIDVPDTTGDLTNTVIGTIVAAGFQAQAPYPLQSREAGRGANGFVGSTGNVTVAHLIGSADVTSGTVLQLAGAYPLA